MAQERSCLGTRFLISYGLAIGFGHALCGSCRMCRISHRILLTLCQSTLLLRFRWIESFLWSRDRKAPFLCSIILNTETGKQDEDN